MELFESLPGVLALTGLLKRKNVKRVFMLLKTEARQSESDLVKLVRHEMDQPAINIALKGLKKMNLVYCQVEGRNRYYTVNPLEVARLNKLFQQISGTDES